MSEGGSQMSDDGGRIAEAGSRKSEVRSQRAEDGGAAALRRNRDEYWQDLAFWDY